MKSSVSLNRQSHFEVTAEVAGALIVKAQEGDTIDIGAVLCEIDESKAATPAQEVESAPPVQSSCSDRRDHGDARACGR